MESPGLFRAGHESAARGRCAAEGVREPCPLRDRRAESEDSVVGVTLGSPPSRERLIAHSTVKKILGLPLDADDAIEIDGEPLPLRETK